MIEIDGKLISDDVFKKKFVCDLSACKGACCVEGEAGAPLDPEEIDPLEEAVDDIKPYMREEGIEAIEKEGVFYVDIDNEPVTQLVNGKECAFVYFDEQGISKCAIETAYKQGKTKVQKPISCHLYPIRTKQLSTVEAVNYHQWPICRSACDCGNKLDVKVYRFLKDAITRKWGESFYKKMESADELVHVGE